MSLFSLLFQDTLTIVFVLFIGILFIVFGLKEYNSYKKFNKEIKNTRDKLRLLNDENNFQGIWYEDNFIINDKKLVKKGQRFLTSVDPIKLCGLPYQSSNKTVPALLTSIGVAGTFLGITLGLSDFDMGNVGNDSTALLHSAAVLLTGMKTAFGTSLVGLVSSVLMILILKRAASAAQKSRKELVKEVTEVCVESSPIDVLQEIASYTKNSSSSELVSVIQQLNQNSSEQLKEFKALSNSFNGDSIAKTLSEQLTSSIESKILPVFSDVTNELKDLKSENKLHHEEMLNGLLQEMESRLIKPITEELSKTSKAVEHSNEVNLQLNQNVEKTLVQVSETVKTIDSFNQNTMHKLEEFASSLKDILSSFKADTQTAMLSITEQVDSVLKSAVEGMEVQRASFDDSTNKAAMAFENMGSQLESTLDARTKKEAELFENIEVRLLDLLSKSRESFSEQTKVIKQTGETASELMNVARIELERGLGDIDTKVLSMSKTVQYELEQFREQYQSNLKEFFTNQNNLLEDTLGKQRNNLVEVVEKFRDVFEQEYKTRHNLLDDLTLQYQHLQGSVKTIERLVKAIGLTESSTFSQLEDIARNVGTQVGELKRQYTEASKVFKEITEALPKAMHQYFEKANQSSELYFKGFDEAASTIHNRLAQAAEFLIEAKTLEKSMKEVEVS